MSGPALDSRVERGGVVTHKMKRIPLTDLSDRLLWGIHDLLSSGVNTEVILRKDIDPSALYVYTLSPDTPETTVTIGAKS